jgi:hypothetical protein
VRGERKKGTGAKVPAHADSGELPGTRTLNPLFKIPRRRCSWVSATVYNTHKFWICAAELFATIRVFPSPWLSHWLSSERAFPPLHISASPSKLCLLKPKKRRSEVIREDYRRPTHAPTVTPGGIFAHEKYSWSFQVSFLARRAQAAA